MVLKKHFLLLLVLKKTVVLLTIFVETNSIYCHSWPIQSSIRVEKY